MLITIERSDGWAKSDSLNLMRHRHMAVIAMLGWYLLTPPWAGINTFDTHAPLGRWYQAASFESAADCERFRTAKIANFRQKSQWQTGTESAKTAAVTKLYEESQCISSLDARLNKH
jgi:hypothetical protein